MVKELFKEPGSVFVIAAFIAIAFIFIESRMTKVKKPWRYYIKYGIFVGGLCSFFVYLNKEGSILSQTKKTLQRPIFLESFPN